MKTRPQRLFSRIGIGTALLATVLSCGVSAAPSLVATIPEDGATGVTPNSFLPLVLFVFDEEMFEVPRPNIAWSGNVDAAKFSCSWTLGPTTLGCSYSGTIPPGTKVTWTLNPTVGGASNLRNLDGDELPTESGSFTIAGGGGGGGEGCDGDPLDPVEEEQNLWFINRQANYLQTSAANPGPDPDRVSLFFAGYFSPTNRTFTQVTMRTPPPGSVQLVLTNLASQFGGEFPGSERFKHQWFYTQEFATPAAMDAAFGNGSYQLNAVGPSAVNGNLSTAASFLPQIPRYANFAALQSANLGGAVTVQWDALAGAKTNDFISLIVVELNSEDGTDGVEVYHAPDECVPIILRSTDVSHVIPAGKMEAGKSYAVDLSFSRLGVYNPSPTGNFLGTGAYAQANTRIYLGKRPDVAGPVRFKDMKINGAQKFAGQVEATPGKAVIIEQSPAVTGPWSAIQTLNPTSALTPVELPFNKSGPPAFFRGRQ